jgi:hypothetical protein
VAGPARLAVPIVVSFAQQAAARPVDPEQQAAVLVQPEGQPVGCLVQRAEQMAVLVPERLAVVCLEELGP